MTAVAIAERAEPYEGDPRPLGIGLNECEAAHADCAPIFEYAGLFEKLFALGVPVSAIDGTDAFDSLACAPVVFLAAGRFEFAKDVRDASDARLALIIPAKDDFGEVADLVAHVLETGDVATWRARVAMLGQELLSAPLVDEPLRAYETALDWLRAGREGLFIIDATKAGRLLAGRRVLVASSDFGVQLRDALTLRPEIFVAGAA